MNREEEIRLEEARLQQAPWRKWGPYVSERQWGTVREDYSQNGDAWDYFTHDQARSRAYRWGEDGIGGICDDKQYLCFGLALWNEQDDILKERLFGLTGSEGNHGEDVKEYYFYLDNTPSHAYMKYLYKYPQAKYPYADLLAESKRRSREQPEYELLDTGIFEENRYFDIFIEYAKKSAEDLCIRISIANRGPASARLHVLPTLWFRNIWDFGKKLDTKPKLSLDGDKIKIFHPNLGIYWLTFDSPQEILFTENTSNTERLFGTPNATPYVKDAFHAYVVNGKKEAVNPLAEGTKGAPYYILDIQAGSTSILNLRLSQHSSSLEKETFSTLFSTRKEEADSFYQNITPFPLSEDMRNVQRQAFAGLLWSKQYYHYNVAKWLKGDPGLPSPPPERKSGRNHEWKTFDAANIFSMPDKWEYPWFASWDLAFHCISLALIDPDFAKSQMTILTKEWYMHPNGELPAYEWSFSDVNPPVQAWAAMRIYQIESSHTGFKDTLFLKEMFQKLSLNFTWWVNRKDADGRNIFEAGFLGLDNIGAFDRTKGPPGGGVLYQADATSWMAMYALNLLQIALELSIEDPVYEHMATKFFEHFVSIADAMNNISNDANGLWNEKSGFYHGVLIMPDGSRIQMPDTVIGIIPLYAVATSNSHISHKFPGYRERFHWFIDHHPELLDQVISLKTTKDHAMLLSLVSPDKLRRILAKVLSSEEFLSPHGIRSLPKSLENHAFNLELCGSNYTLNYEPAEAISPLFGGNSNWRGPVWVPLNYLFIESLQKFNYFLGSDFTVECPTGSGNFLSLWDVASDLSERIISLFLKDKEGYRPIYGKSEKFQTDPHWRDYILFHEYFHGDNGVGLGASHQTGWTGVVAKMIHQYGQYALQKEKPKDIEKARLGNL